MFCGHSCFFQALHPSPSPCICPSLCCPHFPLFPFTLHVITYQNFPNVCGLIEEKPCI
jgi:hypothetical protein